MHSSVQYTIGLYVTATGQHSVIGWKTQMLKKEARHSWTGTVAATSSKMLVIFITTIFKCSKKL